MSIHNTLHRYIQIEAMRIRQKYTITLLITAILPLIIAITLVSWNSRQQTTQLTLAHVESQMSTAAQALGGFFDSRISEIAAYAESPLLQSMDFEKSRPLLISELSRHNGIYEKFILGTDKGHFYNTAGGNPGQGLLRTFDDKNPKAKPKSIAKRDYWKATVGSNIKQEKINIVSDPMISYTTGAKQIVVASTITRDNKVVGMLGGALPWQEMEIRLNKLFRSIFSGQSQDKKIFLVSHSGVYWYHWDKNKIVHIKKDAQGKPLLNEIGQKISVRTNIDEDKNEKFREIGSKIVAGKQGHAKYLDLTTNKNNYVVYTPIPSTKYSIAIEIDESTVLAPVRTLENMFLYTFMVIILISFFFALHSSRSISLPILRLNNATKQVNKGNLEFLELNDSKDEIGELTQSFNHMITGLKDERAAVRQREKDIIELNQSLEQRIQERTKTLELTNEQLQEKIREYTEAKNQLLQHKSLLQNTGKLAKVGGWEAYDGRLHITEELESLLELKPDSVISMEYLIECIEGSNKLKFRHCVDEASENGKSFEIDTQIKTGLGNQFWARIIGEAKWENQQISKISGAIQDISQLKKVDTLKNEFVSTVSHEIRTPLTSINGSVGLLKNSVAGILSSSAMNLIDIIDRNTSRLLFLINDILDIEKIESGKMEFNFSRINLKEILDQSIEINQHYAKKFEGEIRLKECVDGALIEADSQRLLQVLSNLISNAAKFSTNKSVIDVGSCLVNEQLIRVYVTNQGPVISEEFREKIFEKFTQEDGSSKRKYAGTGLGLSISKKIVEIHQGTMDYKSDETGTTFYFDLSYDQE